MEKKSFKDLITHLESIKGSDFDREIQMIPPERWNMYGPDIETYLQVPDATIQTFKPAIQATRRRYMAQIFDILLSKDRIASLQNILQYLSTDTLSHLLPLVHNQLTFKTGQEFSRFLTAYLPRFCLVWEILKGRQPPLRGAVMDFFKKHPLLIESQLYPWLLENIDEKCNSIDTLYHFLSLDERIKFLQHASKKLNIYSRTYNLLRDILLKDEKTLGVWVNRTIRSLHSARDANERAIILLENYLIVPEIAESEGPVSWALLKKEVVTHVSHLISDSTCKEWKTRSEKCLDDTLKKLKTFFDYEHQNLLFLENKCSPELLHDAYQNREKWAMHPVGSIHVNPTFNRCEMDRDKMIQHLVDKTPWEKLPTEAKRILLDTAYRHQSNFSILSQLYEEALTSMDMNQLSSYMKFILDRDLLPHSKLENERLKKNIGQEYLTFQTALSKINQALEVEHRKDNPSIATMAKLEQDKQELQRALQGKMAQWLASILVSMPDEERQKLSQRKTNDTKLAAAICQMEHEKYKKCKEFASNYEPLTQIMEAWEKESPSSFAQTLVKQDHLLQCPNVWGTYDPLTHSIDNFNNESISFDEFTEIPTHLVQPHSDVGVYPHYHCQKLDYLSTLLLRTAFLTPAVVTQLTEESILGAQGATRQHALQWGRFGSKPSERIEEKHPYLSYLHQKDTPIPQTEIDRVFKLGLPFPLIQGKKDMTNLEAWYNLLTQLGRRAKSGEAKLTDPIYKEYEQFLNQLVHLYPLSKQKLAHKAITDHLQEMKKVYDKHDPQLISNTMQDFIDSLSRIEQMN